MTSKISFSKMTVSDIKRRVWIFAILVLILVLLMPVATIIIIDRDLADIAKGSLKMADLTTDLIRWVGYHNGGISFVTICAAIVCAFSGFGYLYSRKKVDVFHSLPVKREKLFLAQYISGVLLFMIPFLACEVLAILACTAKGVITAGILKAALLSVSANFLYFLIFYNVAVIAIMLTGKMLVGALGMLVFWAYFPMMYAIFQGYAHWYFNTYYSSPWGSKWIDWLVCLSPVTLYYGTQPGSSLMGMSVSMSAAQLRLITVIISIVAVVLTFALLIWLYRKRSSEAAGSSMAFAKSKPVIKVFLMVAITLGSGVCFGTLANEESEVWLVFGLLLGLIVAQCFIEVIYTYDIRKVFFHKKSLGIAAGCVVLITLVYRFDLLRYDSYQPNPDNIESVGVSINELDSSISYYDMEDPGSFDYNGGDKYRLEHMNLRNVPEVYEIIQQGIKNNEENVTYESLSEDETADFSSMAVCYKLKNGKEIYRNYFINMQEISDQLKILYDQEEFKMAQYPILSTKAENLGEIEVYDINDYHAIKGSDEDNQKLIEAYQADLMNLTYQDMKENTPFGQIIFQMELSEGSGYKYGIYYPLYSACEKTLTQLKNMGYEIQTEIKISDVTRIRVLSNAAEYWENGENNEGQDYSDPEEIKEIMDAGVLSDMEGNAVDVDREWLITVFYHDQYGNEKTSSCMFRRGKVPAFITQDFGKAVKEDIEG